MTFPGVQGIVGPGWLSTTGFQIRQSKAGMYPGTAGSLRMAGARNHQTVLDSMGSFAPAWGMAAEAITVMDEYAADPHPMAKQNFELDFDQYNNPPGTGDADPGYTGE
jgi:hypothetical protein